MDIHSTEFQSEGLGGGYLSPEEINIIRGALDMTEKKAFVGMTPLDKALQLLSACSDYECSCKHKDPVVSDQQTYCVASKLGGFMLLQQNLIQKNFACHGD